MLVAGLGAVALAGACFGALHSPLFEVRHIEILGNSRTPRAQILSAARLSPGTLMIDAGGARAVRAVDALPWVSSVSFERRWPWSVVVKVSERRPVALVGPAGGGPGGGGTELVDATGRALEVAPAGSELPSLPVVIGAQKALPGHDITPVAPTTASELALLLEAAAGTPSQLARHRVTLWWSRGQGVEARLAGSPTTVLLGDGSQLAFKMAVLNELASRVALSSYSLVDLTVPARPALTPVTGT